MAKVQFGSGVAYISGRIAGTVHARNKGGSYIRRFSVPINPATGFQQGVRASLADASANWRQLTDPNRLAWVAWSSTHPVIDRLGAAILLTGQQAYVALRRNADSAADSTIVLDDPPVEPTFEFPLLAGFVIDADSSGPTLTLATDVQPAADTTLLIYASPAVSPGRTNVSAQTKFLGAATVLSTDTVGTLIDILTDWVSRFGDLSTGLVGKKLAIGVRTYSQGQLSGTTASATIII